MPDLCGVGGEGDQGEVFSFLGEVRVGDGEAQHLPRSSSVRNSDLLCSVLQLRRE